MVLRQRFESDSEEYGICQGTLPYSQLRKAARWSAPKDGPMVITVMLIPQRFGLSPRHRAVALRQASTHQIEDAATRGDACGVDLHRGHYERQLQTTWQGGELAQHLRPIGLVVNALMPRLPRLGRHRTG
jgi:hypothetical protein